MRTTVMEQQETLGSLVRARVGEGGEGGKLTYQAFLRQAVDPETGYRPSIGILQRIIKNEPVKINRQLVRAIAAGLPGVSEYQVKVAVAHEYVGLEVTQPEAYQPFDGQVPNGTTATVVGIGGATEDDLPVTLGQLKRILMEIEQEKREAGDSNES